MSGTTHGFALRAPWYVCERGRFDRFDVRSEAPAIQKYDAPEFVERLLRDPRDSLVFDADEDVWSHPVAVPEANRGAGRLRFATHQLCRTGLRKLYQPSHHRFYAVVVELYCDQPGLPRAASADDVEAGLVMRRLKVDVTATPAELRRLARNLTKDLLAARRQGAKPTALGGPDVTDVLWADVARRLRFETENRELLDRIGADVGAEAWTTGPTGGRWQPVDAAPDGRTEQELPMWRLPTPDWECEAGRTRSLWFGLVPTYSGEHDDQGAPKLDDKAIYDIRCFARRRPPAGRPHCPPQVSWSAPTEPFRLAAFYDPEGTKNRTVSVRLPDFRAVAARAGLPPGPGGVAITSPPESQMNFDLAGATPKPGKVDGATDRTCFFALEIFMIVAFFVFSLFLPVVVLTFQLWWLLALRFCLPPATASLKLLETFFAGGGTLATLPAQAPPSPPAPEPTADRQILDALLGAVGASEALADPSYRFPAADAAALTAVLTPPADTTVPPPEVEKPPPDPLCGGHG